MHVMLMAAYRVCTSGSVAVHCST